MHLRQLLRIKVLIITIKEGRREKYRKNIRIQMVELAPTLQELMVKRRRYLHRYPELSFRAPDGTVRRRGEL